MFMEGVRFSLLNVSNGDVDSNSSRACCRQFCEDTDDQFADFSGLVCFRKGDVTGRAPLESLGTHGEIFEEHVLR